MKPRLQEKYEKEIIPRIMKELGYKNPLQVPRIAKVVINMGVGEAKDEIKHLELAMSELAQITGQKPVIRRAKKAISNFKLKKNAPIGCMVTLRKDRMYEFLDRFINIALPRTKDFKGLDPHSFDGRGNYTIGVKEQIIFPEVKYEKVEKIRGMNITICTTAKTDSEAKILLKYLGFPFRS
jgi:large subunit ribosomal protein L5